MKILVCGVGSIGERHITNLTHLGYKEIILYRNKLAPLRNIKEDYAVFTSLPKALAEKPDVAFICNPTFLHAETIISCADAGCNIFVEKPICTSVADCEDISIAVRRNKVKLMVGYMMRFHPCLIKMKQWLEQGKLGKIIYYRSEWGEYLPDWHPWEDYRKSYAALDSMGGGAALTLSHELDTLLWLAGEYQWSAALFNYGSGLELSSEHGVDFLIQLKTGATASIHLDYFQSPPARVLEIFCESGKVVFDYYQSKVIRFKHGRNDLDEVFDISESFDRNDLFISEIKYFFDCLKNNIDLIPGLKEGCEVVRLIELSKENGKR